MKQKRRKKLRKAWDEFQAEHELSDFEVKLARSTGYPLDRLLRKLATEEFCELPIRQAISLIHSQHEQILAQRRAAIAAGTRKPKVKKKKGVEHDPQWVRAKKLCRLNQDDIRKAKELGMKPKSLIKNIPNSNQKWKLSVKHWIAELYEKRFSGKTKGVSKKAKPRDSHPKNRQSNDSQDWHGYTSAMDAYLDGDFPALYALECERDGVNPETRMKESDHQCADDVPF